MEGIIKKGMIERYSSMREKRDRERINEVEKEISRSIRTFWWEI